MAEGDLPVTADPNVGQPTGQESSLSNWAGDYVTDMLGKGQALSNLDYEAYDGPLTAGTSSLQDAAFGGIGSLVVPPGFEDASGMVGGAYDAAGGGTDYAGSDIDTAQWNNDWAGQYMNPFVQQALNPQMDELRRNSQIQRQLDNASLTKAGAFGGGRQAIMNSELNDNTARLMNETTGKGYRDAYDSAGRMFTSDKDRMLQADKANEQSRQYGAGLNQDAARLQLDAGRTLSDITGAELDAERDIYGDQIEAGGIDRGITAEGIAADKEQWEEERDFPYKQVQYQHSLLGGMPLGSQTTSYGQPSAWSEAQGGAAGIMSLYDQIFG
jgi:hypothetical protein